MSGARKKCLKCGGKYRDRTGSESTCGACQAADALRVSEWNRRCPPGSLVALTLYTGAPPLITITKSEIMGGIDYPTIWLKGIHDPVRLDRVVPLRAELIARLKDCLAKALDRGTDLGTFRVELRGELMMVIEPETLAAMVAARSLPEVRQEVGA